VSPHAIGRHLSNMAIEAEGLPPGTPEPYFGRGGCPLNCRAESGDTEQSRMLALLKVAGADTLLNIGRAIASARDAVA
jgi:hypothetical protein